MMYNIFISTFHGKYNILGLDETKLEVIVKAYLDGLKDFVISGKKYSIEKLYEIGIFEYTSDKPITEFENYCDENGLYIGGFYGHGEYLPEKALANGGQNITDKILGNKIFGENKKINETVINFESFVSIDRIEELKKIHSADFDLSKLVKLCEEINHNFKFGNYMSVGMIGRTIIHHIPPIFGYSTFTETVNNYAFPKSVKKNLESLNSSLKNIADSILHQTIRKQEVMPNEVQVNFKQDMDVLLAEIIRNLK